MTTAHPIHPPTPPAPPPGSVPARRSVPPSARRTPAVEPAAIITLDALRRIGRICDRHGSLVRHTDPRDSTTLLDLWLAAVDDLRALRDTLNRLDPPAGKAVGR